MDNEKKISKWTKFAEWGAEKKVEPISIKQVDGASVNAKPEYCDAAGKIWVFEYYDHDNQGMQRRYETQYDSFYKSVKFQKVEKNKKYTVKYGEIPGKSFKGFTWSEVA